MIAKYDIGQNDSSRVRAVGIVNGIVYPADLSYVGTMASGMCPAGATYLTFELLP
jgi:hypothetical protein